VKAQKRLESWAKQGTSIRTKANYRWNDPERRLRGAKTKDMEMENKAGDMII
jgi:hypothetical protein